MLLRSGIVGLTAVWVMLGSSASLAVESHPGISVEALYSEAVLAFNKKQTAEAIKIINQLLKHDPKHIQALELKALTLKQSGDDEQALRTYVDLMKAKPPEQRGPYHFESGVIFNKQKKFKDAVPQFQQSIRLDFNVVASHLFLGMIHFGQEDLSAAEVSMNVVVDDGTPELQIIGLYYLGMIHLKTGRGSTGIYHLSRASALADDLKDSKVAQDIKKGADAVIAPFGKSQFFANLTLLPQWDSNVSTIPSGSTAADATSRRATFKINGMGGVGWMSSPLGTIQVVPGYRFSLNKNFNALTRSYEYFTNTGSVYLNYRPMALTNGGIKLEGNFTFNNQAVDSAAPDGAYVYRPFSVTGDIGPFLKTQFGNWSMVFETAIRPMSYFSSTDLSGMAYYGKIGARPESKSEWLAPNFGVSVTLNRSAGVDSRYLNLGVGASNQMRLASMQMTLSLDYSYSSYAEASVPRTDSNISIQWSVLRPLTKNFSVMGNAGYIMNISTVPDSYTYNRIMAGVGVSWNM